MSRGINSGIQQGVDNVTVSTQAGCSSSSRGGGSGPARGGGRGASVRFGGRGPSARGTSNANARSGRGSGVGLCTESGVASASTTTVTSGNAPMYSGSKRVSEGTPLPCAKRTRGRGGHGLFINLNDGSETYNVSVFFELH